MKKYYNMWSNRFSACINDKVSISSDPNLKLGKLGKVRLVSTILIIEDPGFALTPHEKKVNGFNTFFENKFNVDQF